MASLLVHWATHCCMPQVVATATQIIQTSNLKPSIFDSVSGI